MDTRTEISRCIRYLSHLVDHLAAIENDYDGIGYEHTFRLYTDAKVYLNILSVSFPQLREEVSRLPAMASPGISGLEYRALSVVALAGCTNPSACGFLYFSLPFSLPFFLLAVIRHHKTRRQMHAVTQGLREVINIAQKIRTEEVPGMTTRARGDID